MEEVSPEPTRIIPTSWKWPGGSKCRGRCSVIYPLKKPVAERHPFSEGNTRLREAEQLIRHHRLRVSIDPSSASCPLQSSVHAPKSWSLTEGLARQAGACPTRGSWPRASRPPSRPPRASASGGESPPSSGFEQQRVLFFWFWGSDACPGSLWAKIGGQRGRVSLRRFHGATPGLAFAGVQRPSAGPAPGLPHRQGQPWPVTLAPTLLPLCAH